MIPLALADDYSLAFPDQEGCHSCVAYQECGGEARGRCMCAWKGSRRYQCSTCSLMCRERDEFTALNRPFEDAARQALFMDGLMLREYVPQGGAFENLPPFIPTQTFQLSEGCVLPDPWVGIGLRSIFKPREDLRGFMRASPTATLLGVLNAPDPVLERFWGLGPDKRREMFERLSSQGMTHVTGPTFSVYAESLAMERLSQLHRHHRVANEAQRAGLAVAPNLYLHNTHGRRLWLAWLQEHTEVQVVSREVSFLKHKNARAEAITSVLELLSEAGRPFHVLLIGVGQRSLKDTCSLFTGTGHTFSVLTKNPVIAGLKGQDSAELERSFVRRGRKIAPSVGKRTALRNLGVMRAAANRIVPPAFFEAVKD